MPAPDNLRAPTTTRRSKTWEYSTARSAIVTGSARGIGRATAELLAEQGAQVLINDLDGDVAEQAADEIDGETAVFAGDLTKPGAPDELVQKAVDAFGKIDIIVNNAGYTLDAPIHKMSDEQFQAMLDIHTVVPFRVLRAAAPHLREPAKKEREEGHEVFRKIVNVSSISGTMGNAGQANYSSGKAGVVGLTKTLAKEWGQFKINVNAVAFGFIETRLTAGQGGRATRWRRTARRSSSASPSRCARWPSMMIPLGRPAHPRGGRRRRVLPVLAVVELRARPGAERHRRAVRRDEPARGEPCCAQQAASRRRRFRAAGPRPRAAQVEQAAREVGARRRGEVGDERGELARRGALARGDGRRK